MRKRTTVYHSSQTLTTTSSTTTATTTTTATATTQPHLTLPLRFTSMHHLPLRQRATAQGILHPPPFPDAMWMAMCEQAIARASTAVPRYVASTSTYFFLLPVKQKPLLKTHLLPPYLFYIIRIPFLSPPISLPILPRRLISDRGQCPFAPAFLQWILLCLLHFCCLFLVRFQLVSRPCFAIAATAQ